MIQEQSFFTRVAHWFKNNSGHPAAEHVGTVGKIGDGKIHDGKIHDGKVHDGKVGEDGLLNPITDITESPADTELSVDSGNSIFPRRRTQQQTIQNLEEGFHKLTNLIGSIDKHLKAQDERTRQSNEALLTLAQTVSELPQGLHNQQTQLAAIAEQFEAANARVAQWDDAVSELPNFIATQRETIGVVREQFNAAAKTQKFATESMDRFRETVATLSQSSTASIDTLKQFQVAATDRDERLVNLISEQNKKFSILFSVAIAIASCLSITTLVVLFVK